MIHCMIKSCRTSGNIPGVTYNLIPSKHAKQWFPALQESVEEIIADHIVVCSKHFTPEVKTEPVEVPSGDMLLVQPVMALHLQPIIVPPPPPPPRDFVYILPDERVKEIINGKSSACSNENFNSANIKNNFYANIQQKAIPDKGNSLVFTNDSFLDRMQNGLNDGIKLELQSDSDIHEENIKEQNRIIQDIHNYSVSPGKEQWVATRKVIRKINKKIKCAQQKNRRLENRFVRLKKEYEELKRKKN